MLHLRSAAVLGVFPETLRTTVYAGALGSRNTENEVAVAVTQETLWLSGATLGFSLAHVV